MSRAQADQVALANDARGWESNTATHAKPLSDVFIKNAFASGAIIPPEGEGAEVRALNLKVGLAALFFGACGVVAFLFAVLR